MASKNVIWEMHRMMLPQVSQQIIKTNNKGARVEKPILTEDKLQELEYKLRTCLSSSLSGRFFYYKEGVIKSIVGIPTKLQGRKIVIQHSSGQMEINLSDILDIAS